MINNVDLPAVASHPRQCLVGKQYYIVDSLMMPLIQGCFVTAKHDVAFFLWTSTSINSGLHSCLTLLCLNLNMKSRAAWFPSHWNKVYFLSRYWGASVERLGYICQNGHVFLSLQTANTFECLGRTTHTHTYDTT